MTNKRRASRILRIMPIMLLIGLMATSCNSSERKSDREKNDEYYARFEQRAKKRHKKHRREVTHKAADTIPQKVEERNEPADRNEPPVSKEIREKAKPAESKKPAETTERSTTSNTSTPKSTASEKSTNTAPKHEEEEKTYTVVEESPSYPGGENALNSFLASHLMYPSIAAENGVQGRVTLKVQIKKDGSVGEVRITRSLSKECDTEAVRVVKKLARFNPGRQNGEPVNVWLTLPITFRLQ